MLIGVLAAFVGVSLLVIVSPGQDTALTVRNTLLGGRRAGLYTALGVASGQALWTAATSLGLAGVLLASQPAFLALKVVGVIYLGWLALQALRDALFPDRHGLQQAATPLGRTSSLGAYRQGALSNLSNPKMVVFFISLLPQFAPPGSFVAMLALGLLFCLLTLTWLTVYALAVARVERVLRRPTIRRILHGITGGVFVGLGVRLATMSR
jgi:threonine/homoserine/homoserine lactone efflux protein